MTNQDPDEPAVYRQHRFAPPPGASEILVVRHGESAPYVAGTRFEQYEGHEDPPLAAEGREQALLLGERLANEQIDAIYVTPLRRTSETAAPLAERLGLEPIVVPELREVYLGEWEGGLYRQKMAERDPAGIQMMIEERWDAIPGAESNEQLSARVIPAIEAIAAAHVDVRVVVVVHGGVIGSIFHHAAGSRPFAFLGADNASISHLVVTPFRWLVRRFNDTGHLDGELSAQPQALT